MFPVDDDAAGGGIIGQKRTDGRAGGALDAASEMTPSHTHTSYLYPRFWAQNYVELVEDTCYTCKRVRSDEGDGGGGYTA